MGYLYAFLTRCYFRDIDETLMFEIPFRYLYKNTRTYLRTHIYVHVGKGCALSSQ